MIDRDRNTERIVRGIKPALSVMQHSEAEAGFCSLRMVTFNEHGAPNVSNVSLTREEADDVRFALAEMLTHFDPRSRG